MFDFHKGIQVTQHRPIKDNEVIPHTSTPPILLSFVLHMTVILRFSPRMKASHYSYLTLVWSHQPPRLFICTLPQKTYSTYTITSPVHVSTPPYPYFSFHHAVFFILLLHTVVYKFKRTFIPLHIPHNADFILSPVHYSFLPVPISNRTQTLSARDPYWVK